MNHLCKRSLSLIMAILMVLSLIPANPVHVHAEGTVASVYCAVADAEVNNGLAINASSKDMGYDDSSKSYKILGNNKYITYKLSDDLKNAFLEDFANKVTVEVELKSDSSENFSLYYDKVGDARNKATRYVKSKNSAGNIVYIYEVENADFTTGNIMADGDVVAILSHDASNPIFVKSIRIVKGWNTNAPTFTPASYEHCNKHQSISIQSSANYAQLINIRVSIKKADGELIDSQVITDVIPAGSKKEIISANQLKGKISEIGSYIISIEGYWNANDNAHKINETIAYTYSAHTEVTITGKDATCTEDGLTEGKKCTVCGKMTVEQDTIDAQGHAWGDWESNEDGTHSRVCTTDASHTENGDCNESGTDGACSECGYKVAPKVFVAEVNSVGYATLAEAVAAANAGDTVVIIADIADEIVDVKKNLTITGPVARTNVTLNNVGINAKGADELTVSNLSFTGNSWINSGTAEKLTVSGVTANVKPNNAGYTNSRSAFISLGRSEQQQLALTVENCNIVSAGGSDPILGWASITKATLTGNTFGSETAYQANSDSVKFMAIADGATFTITNNTIYSNYNGIVFGQNTTRENKYSVYVDGNTFKGGADHIWIEISSGDTVHATLNATSSNTVNGNAFTVSDIKYRSAVIKNWSSYAGVDVVTDEEGKVIGGNFLPVAAPKDEQMAEGYEFDAETGTVVESKVFVAEVNGVGYESIADALEAAQSGDVIVLLADVTLDRAVTLTNIALTITGDYTLNASDLLTLAGTVSLNAPKLTGDVAAAGNAVIKDTNIGGYLYLNASDSALTFQGDNKVNGFSASYYNNVITIGAGAYLEITGSQRLTIGWGNTFNITGTIEDAKTADKSAIKPSLKVAAGITVNGSSALTTFNVTNAYIVLSSTCGTNKNATGKFVISFTNTIADLSMFKQQYAYGTYDVDFIDSVINVGANLVFLSPDAVVDVDNSNITVNSSFGNAGTFTLSNGSAMTVKSMLESTENGYNAGLTIVDDATLNVTGGVYSGYNTGKLQVVNGGVANINKIVKSTIELDADSTVNVTTIDATSSIILGAGASMVAPEGLTVTTAEGWEVKYENGAFVSVQPKVYVAEVGGVKYESLQEAIDAAGYGDTVTLLADIALTAGVKIPANKEITLDLNGKTISGVNNTNQGNLIYIENTGKLTVKDSAGNGKITYASGSSNVGFAVDVKGDFVLESGIIELTGSWSIGYAVDVRPNSWGTAYTAATTFVMNGGSVISSDGAVRVASSSARDHTNVSAAFTMNGGKIDAAWDGVFIQQSDSVYDVLSFTMNDGTIESDLNPVRVYGPAATDYVNGAECMNIVLNDGTMTYTGTETYTWIIDGVLRTGGGSSIETILESGELTVSAAVAQSSELPEGYKWEENADGNFVVVAKDYIAQVGEKKFESFLEALQYAIDNNASELKVLADVREKMEADFDLKINADLTITADQPVNLEFYNEGTTRDFAVGSTNNNTLTIGKNVHFDLVDRVIWLGFWGNNVDVIVEGYLGGYQIWHGADTTVTATGTLDSHGEAFIMRRDATLTVNGGTVNANYFQIYSGHIVAEDATITAGLVWVNNDHNYGSEGTGSIDLDNTSFVSRGEVKIYAGEGKTVPVTLTNGAAVTAAGDLSLGEGASVKADATSSFTAKGKSIFVAEVGNQKFTTVTEAINAANDGDTVQLLPGTITEYVAPWANDPTHASEKSITLVGAENFGTVLTGGLYLGYDDSQNRGHTITVKGIAFEGKGILVAGQDTVIIEGNKFTNITETVDGKTSSATANAISVIGKNVNAVIKNNEIDTTVSGGINLRNTATVLVEGNTVTNTWDNSITIPGNTAEGTVVIRDNTLSNWGTSGIEGRAVRVKGGKATISGNVMTNAAAPEQFVKTTETTSLEVPANYWNGVSPMTDGMFSCDVSADPALILSSYYTDAGKTNLVNISASVAKIGNAYFATLQDAINAAQNGETVTLLADINVGTGYALIRGKEIAIDLNGHNITGTGYRVLFVDLLASQNKDGKLTLVGNGTVENTGTTSGSSYAVYVGGNSELVVEAGATVKSANGYAVFMAPMGAGRVSKLTVNGGTVTGRYAVSGSGQLTDTSTVITVNSGAVIGTEVGIYQPQPGTVTVNGGTVSSDLAALAMRRGTASITGGTIVGLIDVVGDYDATKVAITGGDFTNATLQYADGNGNDVTKADAVELAAPADYKWVNGVLTACEYVAEVNGDKCETMADIVDTIKAYSEAGIDAVVKFYNDITINKDQYKQFAYGTGNIIFTADAPVTVTLKADFDFMNGDIQIKVEKNVTLNVYDNAGGIYVFYGPGMYIEGNIGGGQNWGCLYLAYGKHTVAEGGKLSIGRVHMARTELTVNGEIDSNYLLVEESTLTLDGALVDANYITDTNNGGLRYGASKIFMINGAVVKAGTMELKHANSVLTMDPTASLTANKVQGAGKIVIDVAGFNGNAVEIIKADMSGFTGTVELINNDNYAVCEITSTGVIVKKAVAAIGNAYYATLADAIAAVQEGDVIELMAGTIEEGTIKLPATLKNVTFKGEAGAVLKNMTIMASDGNSFSYVGLTFDGITFVNSRLSFTGWRNGEEVIENLTITNCVCKNLNDNTNSAFVHINKDASEPVNGFTFTNNVLDGLTGGSKSGVYAQLTGNVVFTGNVINNVSFRPYVIQVTTDDGIADEFIVTGNTFSGSAAGRAQGLGNNAEGTDTVKLVVSENIFKGITEAQQICYWNFNPETTTADLSKNYYDIDILANPNKIYFNSAAQDAEDLIEMGVYPYYADEAMTELVTAPAIMVTYPDGKIEYYNDMLEAVPYTTNCPRLEGAIIKLLSDIEAPGIRLMENGMILDLNGHTYTIIAGTGSQGTNTSGFQIRPEVTTFAKIMNGTIKVAAGAPVVWMFNSYAADFIVEDVTVDCTNMAWGYGNTCYVVVSRADDNVQFTGNTSIVNFNDAVAGTAINVGGTMAIGENVTGYGAIELDAGAKLTAKAGLTVTTVADYKVVYTDGVYTSVAKAYVAEVNGNKFETVAEALKYAKDAGLTEVVITLLGANSKADAIALEDAFNLYTAQVFDKVTVKQADASKVYYIYDIYTGSRTNGGQFVFDGVNIVVIEQYIFEGNVVLTNNSIIKSVADANCFIYNGITTIEPGSVLQGVIEDFRGGDMIIDGGKTDGSYNTDPSFQDAIIIVNWGGDKLVLKNGAYAKINAANEIGRLTINAGAAVEMYASKLEAVEYITANGTLQLDLKSLVSTKKITGNGKIIVDVTGFDGEVIELITADMTGFTGTVELINNSNYAVYELSSTGLTIAKKTLEGSGTQEDPYVINSVEDLILFRDSVNAGETKYSAPGVYVALGANIDLAGINWVGIGSATAEHGFMGNFDGNGFKIKNLTITNPDLDADGYAYAGLFAVTEGADGAENVIKNLTIENVTINTTGHIVAAAIAYPYYTTVENVTVCGDINITGGDYTAGALAYTRRCVNASNVTVTGNAGSTITGARVVGGVISDIQMNGGLTANYSNFSASGLTITGENMVGGISGIIATQTLNGATVRDVTLFGEKAGIVAGALGGTSTITNVTHENVTGATAIIGSNYNGSAVVQAKIGDTYYSTLENALAAAQEGQTIELLAPVVVAADETLTLDKDVKIVYTSNVVGEDMFTVRGTLNVAAGTITYVNTDTTGSNVTVSTISCEPGSVLNVTGGTIENKTVKADGSSIYSFAIDMLTNGNLGDVTVTISGGTVYSDYMAIRQFNNGTACKNSLTISGGYVYGAKRAVQVHMDNTAAYTTISGGKIKGGNYALCLFANNKENLTVSDGEFLGDIYSATNGFITGGTFDSAVDDAYIAEDHVLVDNGDGTFGVVSIEESGYVAQNAGTGEYYDDVFAALNAATAGQTVKLIADAEAPYFIVKPGVTLDLNGNVLTTEYAAAVAGANVIDSTLNGMLKTNVGSIVLNPANSMMAVYDDVNGGYIFTKFKFNFSQDAEYTGEGIKINALFAPDMRVIDLLKDGASTNDLKLMVRLTWGDESEDGDAVQEFIFKDATISRVFSSNGGTQTSFGRMFTMIITGFDDVNNLRVNLVAESSTNAIVVSSKTLTVTN